MDNNSASQADSESHSDNRHRFAALVNAWLPDLYRYALWLSRDQNLAEELVQETLLRAWRRIDTLREPAAAKSWLITILRRELARHYSRKQHDTVQLEELSLPCPHGGPSEAAEQADMQQAILELEPAYREPLVMQVVLGYSVQEIADTLVMKTATVLTRLHRARQQLRQALVPKTEARA